jgi:probable phosphoglycerate mutase
MPFRPAPFRRSSSGSLFDSDRSDSPNFPSQHIVAHIDGGARGNPGPAGFGAYIQDENGRVLAELSEFLGAQTNNFAEYSGLIAALEYAVQHGYRAVKVISDSELLVKQIKGQYKVRSESLLPIYEEAKALIKQLDAFQVKHVLRHLNKDADRLAINAMDRGLKTARTDRADAYAKPPAQSSANASANSAPKEVRGFVRNGVVEFTGDALPDGIFVYVRPARKE